MWNFGVLAPIKHIYKRTYVHTYLRTRAGTEWTGLEWNGFRVCVNMYIYVYMYVYIYIYIYMYTVVYKVFSLGQNFVPPK